MGRFSVDNSSHPASHDYNGGDNYYSNHDDGANHNYYDDTKNEHDKGAGLRSMYRAKVWTCRWVSGTCGNFEC